VNGVKRVKLSQNTLKPADLPLEVIFPPDGKFTFLVGAGISMEKPSALPSAVKMGEVLVKLCTPFEEVDNILQLDGLRYELIVEVIQKFFDPELNIMNYFEHFTTPNILHYFLAHTITHGQQVVTTNFDYLVEYALIEIHQENTNIVPVITRQDFVENDNPQRLIADGKYLVYKLHGSKKNIITGEDTKDSLVTTLSALGREREAGETFAIESFKKPAVHRLLEGRILVVMGYSGSDDFDIGPTLKELHNLSHLVWINHSSELTPEIFPIGELLTTEESTLRREDHLLIESLKPRRYGSYPLKFIRLMSKPPVLSRISFGSFY
jgi:hypothetical protein